MEFTKEECLILINVIRDNDLIYNPSNQFYKSRIERESVWNQIAGLVNKPAPVCKKKWRNLRDHFIRGHLRKGNTISNWVYYEPLRFLEFLKPTRPPDGKSEPCEDDDDVFSETEEVHSKRLRTEDTETYAFDNNNEEVGLIPVKIITDDGALNDLNVADIQNDRDTDMFMVEISNRIKMLPQQLQDIAKVNILAHITELELQHSAQC